MVVKAPPTVAFDRSTQTALRTLRKLRADRDELDLKIKANEDKIKKALADAEEGTVRGRTVVTWRRVLRQSLSATLVKKRDPELAQECTVQTEVRVFRLIEDPA
jgi:predicted phage-related endonuclease